MTTHSTPTVEEPIPIFKLAHHYMLYDIDTVTYLRREYDISGVLIGTLAQASQQNVFLGLPLQLMPEEARWLVEKKIAYIVDDVSAHRESFLDSGLGVAEKKAYQAALRKQGLATATEQNKKSTERKKMALQRQGNDNWNDIPDDMLKPVTARAKRAAQPDNKKMVIHSEDGTEDETLFTSCESADSVRLQALSSTRGISLEPHGVTPTASYPPLQAPPRSEHGAVDLPQVPKSYPLYKYLHEQGYFMAPGLRFGCQYLAYPGDPLRFHSHFLCNGMEWDQEFDLLSLVGGGRLGTGVKKGFLVGGEKAEAGTGDASKDVRAFSIEWGGM